jgi:hypothetical protein
MRSFFIKEVNLIIDNTRSLKIRERNDDPIELSPLGVAIIKMQPYSQLENDFKVPMMYEEKMFLILNMASEKPIIARVPKHFTSRKHKKYEPVMVHTNTYNGIILQPGDKYALHYFSKPSESEEKTIIIHESGVMSDSLPQYNAETHEFSIFNGIPTETANSFEETKKLFEEVSKPFGSKVQLVELEKRLP